jgi:hypothetical protein
LQHHNLRESQAVDDRHQDHEGCGADLIDLILTEATSVDRRMTYEELTRQIDARLFSIKTQSKIARKPISIK